MYQKTVIYMGLCLSHTRWFGLKALYLYGGVKWDFIKFTIKAFEPIIILAVYTQYLVSSIVFVSRVL